jgi:hypothetical protein
LCARARRRVDRRVDRRRLRRSGTCREDSQTDQRGSGEPAHGGEPSRLRRRLRPRGAGTGAQDDARAATSHVAIATPSTARRCRSTIAVMPRREGLAPWPRCRGATALGSGARRGTIWQAGRIPDVPYLAPRLHRLSPCGESCRWLVGSLARSDARSVRGARTARTAPIRWWSHHRRRRRRGSCAAPWRSGRTARASRCAATAVWSACCAMASLRSTVRFAR